MNKTLVFLIIGIFLTIFSLSLVKRSDSETVSNAMDFSTEVDENGDVTVGTTSPRVGTVGSFTTGASPSTGDGALGNTNATTTFSSDPNNSADPTGTKTGSNTGAKTIGTGSNKTSAGTSPMGSGSSTTGAGSSTTGTGSRSGSGGARD